MRLFQIAMIVGLCFVPSRSAVRGAAPTPEQEEFFEKKIRPVLARACYECHSTKKQQAGLRVDHVEFMVKGGENGSILKPGDVTSSRLWEVLQHDPLDTQMPPDSKLPDAELADIRRWIEMGAPWPAADKPVDLADGQSDQWKQHWAFQPISRPAPPETTDKQWPVTEIDRFVLARLEQENFPVSDEADRATLLRRLKYDLLGLPPTYEEIQAFANDPSSDAYEKLIDSYLNSPQFGERWGRHWLDVSRYADTKGYVFQEDRNYADSWKYRDWVIGAFNRDLPYDQFLKLQIAAEQFSDDPNDLHAMGYLTLGRRFINNKHDIIDDRIDVVTRGMMGLTVTCARCHDHKYDPIPTADYYSLYGVFDSCDEPKDAPSTLRLVDKDKPREPYVFLRGGQGNHGPRVPRQFLQVVAREDRKPFEHGSGRKEMAEAIATGDNPLTARVWVNRVWGHLIGSELVRTPSDFGVRSDPPTHPELLDYLAGYLIDHQWSTKQVISEIVRSRVYRQSSRVSETAAERDVENNFLSHMNRKRVDFEGMRDAVLAVSGNLDLTLGGPSVPITTQGPGLRRTTYAFIDRQNLPEVFRVFDFASPDTHVPKRYLTNVPQQALFLMNSPFLLNQSKRLSDRVEGDPAPELIQKFYRLALARDPNAAETQLALQYLQNAPAETEVVRDTFWTYGYGEVDPEAGTLKSFTELPFFTGTNWQGGDKLPDATLGWVTLTKTGGHVGNDLQHAAVRRWIAPRDGIVTIRGELKHGSDQGDGVRGRILLDGKDQKGLWQVHNKGQGTEVNRLDVKAGQTVDFVTDCVGSPNHDSFEWKVRLNLRTPGTDGELRASSEREFAGPAPTPLTPREQLAQILLLSNEFQFVD